LKLTIQLRSATPTPEYLEKNANMMAISQGLMDQAMDIDEAAESSKVNGVQKKEKAYRSYQRMTPEDKALAKDLLVGGLSQKEIAEILGREKGTISKNLKNSNKDTDSSSSSDESECNVTVPTQTWEYPMTRAEKGLRLCRNLDEAKASIATEYKSKQSEHCKKIKALTRAVRVLGQKKKKSDAQLAKKALEVVQAQKALDVERERTSALELRAQDAEKQIPPQNSQWWESWWNSDLQCFTGRSGK